MGKYRVLITEPVPDEVIEFIGEFANVDVGAKGDYDNESALLGDLKKYDALLCMLSTPITETVLKSAPEIKIIANYAVGYNNIDVKAAKTLGIRVANTPDVLTEACGDFTMALLMATTRKFFEAEKYLRAGKFKSWNPIGFLGMELRNKRLGIVGMGRIGQAFAHRAKAFGMQIYYTNRKQLPSDTETALEANFVPDLRELAKKSDVLSLNCPLTPETHHLINKEILEIMPDHSILLNTSRGPVVDETALADALHNGTIGGAGLDVFEKEPIVHPKILTAPNCTILPHIASATFETRKNIGLLAASAIQKVFNGTPDNEIHNLVTK